MSQSQLTATSKKKENKKVSKYQRLKAELERIWGENVSVVSMVIGAFGAVTPKLGEWLKQISEITLETTVQRSKIVGKAKVLCRTLRLLHTENYRLTYDIRSIRITTIIKYF